MVFLNCSLERNSPSLTHFLVVVEVVELDGKLGDSSGRAA